MKSKFLSLFIVTVFVSTISCTTVKRYSSVQPSGEDNTLAGIDLFGYSLSAAKPENGNKTLWDLSADAQAQYIRILNTRYPDNEKFLQAMSCKYLAEEDASLQGDYVSKDLRMIFSVSKQRHYAQGTGSEHSPADRIEYLKITLTIPDDSGVKFTGWNMFTTEYGSIDIADVSFSRSLELDATGLLLSDTKETDRELSAGVKTSSSLREDQEIKYRYLRLNGRLNNNQIEMEEEGTREIDLTGNITADLSLEFEKFPEMITDLTGLKDSTGRFNEAGKISIQHSDAVIPCMENVKDTVSAELRMDYIFRNVLNGQKTFAEWDDRIKYYRGTVSKTIPLFTSGDYVPDFYCIGTDRDPEKRDIIKISSSGNKEYNLIFRTWRDACEFYEWLTDYCHRTDNNDNTVDIGGYRLKFRNADFKKGMFAWLSVIPCYR